MLNVVDIPTDPLLLKSMYKTLSTVFPYVDIWMEAAQTDVKRYTYVISAQTERAMPQQLIARQGFKRNWHNVTRQITSEGTELTDIPLLTDDYAPVERLSAELVLKEYGL